MFELVLFLASIVLALPRLLIPLIWIFIRWFLTDPFTNWWWILAGWILCPFTLLLYCGFFQFNHGDWQMWQYIFLGILMILEIILSLKNIRRGLGLGEK